MWKRLQELRHAASNTSAVVLFVALTLCTELRCWHDSPVPAMSSALIHTQPSLARFQTPEKMKTKLRPDGFSCKVSDDCWVIWLYVQYAQHTIIKVRVQCIWILNVKMKHCHYERWLVCLLMGQSVHHFYPDWISQKWLQDSHGPQRMNPADVSGPLTLPIALP